MDEYVKVKAINNAVEATILEAALKERGIPHLMISYHDSAYDGLFQAQKGWGIVKAPQEFVDEVKAIYEDVARHEWEPPAESED